jgi:hypothetical protein
MNKIQVALSGRIPKALVAVLARQSLEKARARPLARQKARQAADPEPVTAPK